MLTIHEEVQRFEHLPNDEKIKVLLQISYYVTVSARDVSQEGDCQQQRDRLLVLNEIQHKLVAQILAVLKNSSTRYSDNDFFLILVELTKRANVSSYLHRALSNLSAG